MESLMKMEDVLLSKFLDHLLVLAREVVQQDKQKETTMTDVKTESYVILGEGSTNEYVTYEKAVDQAKRFVGDGRRNGLQAMKIFKAVAVVTSPVPEAIVTTL